MKVVEYQIKQLKLKSREIKIYWKSLILNKIIIIIKKIIVIVIIIRNIIENIIQ